MNEAHLYPHFYRLTWALFPKKLWRFKDGYLERDGYGNGVLVRVTDGYRVWWHRPERYIKWNPLFFKPEGAGDE